MPNDKTESVYQTMAQAILDMPEFAEALDLLTHGERGAENNSAAQESVAGRTGDWLPIDSAPIGDDLLLYCPHRHQTNPERIEVGYAANGRGSYHAWATHWMPLPLPPCLSESSENEQQMDLSTKTEGVEA